MKNKINIVVFVSQANEKIYEFDKSNDERNHCKIGFIYQGRDQKEEYELFANDKITEDMIDFLQLLADRVRLKGFNKYRGDLDVKEDLHGEYSYHTAFENHEIMFNIAPMILPSKTNGPRIERKGLVSNAFVCIVFQESGSEFHPEMISGKVTQVYITVQPRWIDGTLYYKVFDVTCCREFSLNRFDFNLDSSLASNGSSNRNRTERWTLDMRSFFSRLFSHVDFEFS